jgi:putative transposase
VQGGSLKNLELVRAYSVCLLDRRSSELVTWHVKALQRALDLIWDNIEWRYSFPELVRRGGKLITNMGLKMMIPIIPRDRAFKKRLREELMKDNPYAALDRLCYQDSLLDYGELEEEISKGEG